MSLTAKISLLGVGSALIASIALVAIAARQSSVYNVLAQAEVDGLIAADLDHLAHGIYNLVQTENEAVQQQVNFNLNITRHILEEAGGVSLSREMITWTAVNQCDNSAKEVALPKVLIGGQWLGRNPSPLVETPVVDEVMRLTGEKSTIFQRMNEEGDMLRVATTVHTTDEERGIGTFIPARNPDGTRNPVIDAILKGEGYQGRAFVVNAWYLTAYEQLKDAAGNVIGMLFVGVKQEHLMARLRPAILQVKIGTSGYAFVLGGKGEGRGHYIVSQRGERDGEDIWESKDFDGRPVIQEIIGKTVTLKPGELGTMRYRWQNPEDPMPRWKIARLAYYAPWDWVIGVSAYEDELQHYQTVLRKGQQRMTTIMCVTGMALMLLLGFVGVLVASTITRPVRQMTKTVETITHGDLNHAVDIRSRDEIGVLADSFNFMTRKLSQTLDELRTSELRLSEIINFLPDATFSVDLDHKVITWNKAIEEMTGVKSADIVGKGDYEYALPFYGVRRPILIDLVFMSDKEIEAKYHFVTREGGTIWGETDTLMRGDRHFLWGKAVPLYDSKGKIIGAIESIRNITERKCAEEALRRSQRQLQDIAANIPGVIYQFFVRPDGAMGMSYVSHRSMEILGLDNNPEGYFERIIAHLGEEDRRRLLESVQHAVATPSRWEFEGQYHKPSGELVWLRGMSSPQQIGDQLLYNGVILDVTERKCAELKLAEAQALLTAAIEQTPAGILIADAPDVRIRIANSALLDIHGVSLDPKTEMPTGMNPLNWQIFHADGSLFAPEDLPLSQAVLFGRALRNVEAIIRRPNGEDRWVLVNAAPIRNADGSVIAGMMVVTDITNRKKAEEGLKFQNVLLATEQELSIDGILVVDEHTKILSYNKRFLEIWGVPPALAAAGFDEPVLQLVSDRIVDAQQFLEKVRHLYAHRDETSRDEIALKDGRTLDRYSAAMFGSEGRYYGRVWYFRDVTDLKQATAALRESERRLSEIIDFLPDATFAVDRNGRVIAWNKAIEVMTGIKAAKMLGRTDYEYAVPFHGVRRPILINLVMNHDPAIEKQYDYISREGNALCVEFEGPASKTGERLILWGKAVPLCDSKGNIVGAIESIRDITGRKHTEVELKHLKDYLSNIINSMPSILVGVDRDGIVTQWNRQAELVTGNPARDAIGKPIQALLPDFSHWFEAVRDTMAQRHPASLEKMLVMTNGERRFYDLMAYPLVTNGVEGSVIRIEDVTEKARIHDLLIQTEKMMSIGGVAAGMAHEINNPLGIISLTTDNIMSRLSSEQPDNRKVAEETGINLDHLCAYLNKRDVLKFIQIIQKASSRAAKIVSNMLHFSRRSESIALPVQLSEIMERAVEFAANDYDLRKRCNFRDVEIMRRYEAGMPNVQVVAVEIEQVFLNLIKNAAQAMVANPPERKPRMSLRLRTERGYAVAEVEDNGPGMEESVRRRIFEPFFTTKTPGMGTGLGLSVAYMIVTQNHKGLIDVRSSPDNGALFVVHLPLA